MLEDCDIRSRPTTTANPQANAVCERMHQTMGNILRTLLHSNNLNTNQEAEQVIDDALSTTMHALRTTVSQALGKNSPGSLVFNRDMFLNIPLTADFTAIQQNRQLQIDRNLENENRSRWNRDYSVGDLVLIIEYTKKRKLKPKTSGPYPILQVYTNGTVTIRRTANVRERVNIRRIKPYYEME